jgi:hypothetical protein
MGKFELTSANNNEVISTIKRQKASHVETAMAETLSERQHHVFPPSELQPESRSTAR